MLLALTATLAIVVQDRAPLRAEPRANAAEMTALGQGDVVEIRGERADYVKVYEYGRERGGYIKSQSIRRIGVSEADAPELLAVMRFLRDSPGLESLGISYGAAYLKAVPSRALTAEPFDAIARMAERLADAASGSPSNLTNVSARLQVVEQLGVRMRTFERNGRMRVCYDGELFRRVLSMSSATAEERIHAALGLTRPECIDPNLGPLMRAALDDERSALLDGLDEQGSSAMTKSRLHARRAGVWASIAYERARRGERPQMAAQRAIAELADVHAKDLGDDRRGEYVEAAVRVNAIRWAAVTPPSGPMVANTAIPPNAAVPTSEAARAHATSARAGEPANPTPLATATTQPSAVPVVRAITPLSQTGQLMLTATPGEPGQTCLTLAWRRRSVPLVQKCTYGIVWLASAQTIAQEPALVLAVQPLESWRELWIFHEVAGQWTLDALSPGADDPEQGYVEFAGFAPGTRRLLIAREVKERTGRYRQRFELLRIDDLALVRTASTPDLLRDFGRWQDVAWRRDTLALR
jgi:hypothetical protein